MSCFPLATNTNRSTIEPVGMQRPPLVPVPPPHPIDFPVYASLRETMKKDEEKKKKKGGGGAEAEWQMNGRLVS